MTTDSTPRSTARSIYSPYQDTATITFTSEDLLGLARRLKQQSGNVWIIGGQAILTPLIADDLIDELYLQIAPVTLGQGKRLFGDLNRRHHFHLQSVHPLGPLAELVYEKEEN